MLHDFEPAYASFLSPVKDPSAVNVNVVLELGSSPDMKQSKKIFDSGQSWAISLQGSDYLLSLTPPAFGKEPVWTARFQHNLAGITVYCSEMLMKSRKGKPTVSNPIRYPLDQLLLMYVLAQHEGAILHAAGIAMNKKGYIFPGRSGAGKSTLTRQFFSKKRGEALSDDRIVVRSIDHKLRVFGTPWPGEACIAQNKYAPLSALFFICHGNGNRIRDLSREKAFERLLPVTSIPWYDRDITEKLLLFCEDMVSRVPAYELCFKPSGEVVDVFENFIKK